jgi:hypothetical protein
VTSDQTYDPGGKRRRSLTRGCGQATPGGMILYFETIKFSVNSYKEVIVNLFRSSYDFVGILGRFFDKLYINYRN